MCGCRNGASAPQQSNQQFEVRLPNGDTLVVNSEHEAKVAVTRAGGGTFSRR
jgi:hypothetical protein